MDTVTIGHARFSHLGDGLVRLEYAPDGRFDDRPTFRALTLPPPQPFATVMRDGDEHVLRTAEIEIRYRPAAAGPPDRTAAAPPELGLTRDTLRITWSAGGLTGLWRPGDLDPLNLGGVGTLDHVRRTLLPHGVHPAGRRDLERAGEKNLVTNFLALRDFRAAHPEFLPGGDAEWNRIKDDVNLWPPELRARIDEWLRFPPGMVSRAGWTVLDETGWAFFDPATSWLDRHVRPDYQNLFFWCYGRDYARALRQYVTLCGRVPLPPRWALGPWYSCYERYSAADEQRIVEDFAHHSIPLDVLIIDADWHVNGWNGWEWNTELFPDVPAFFRWKEQAGVKVALNLHGESIGRPDAHFKEICRRLGVPEDVPNPAHVRFLHESGSWTLDHGDPRVWETLRDVCYQPNELRGVDFWWLDNWQGMQDGYNSCLWINHLVTQHTQSRTAKRPLILGRVAGVGSHRYPAYFSGDTHAHWEVLACELEANVRAGQVGMNYLSHDLGGFKLFWPGEPIKLVDPELYVRWMQMGALSPVMRVHSDHGTREPWKYGPRVLEAVRAAYHLHVQLVPYFYHLGREAYDTGLPIHRPLWFLHPDDGAAYDVLDQYYLGERLLAAPVATAGGRRRVYLPAGTFRLLHDGTEFRGPTTVDWVWPLEEIPLFARAGSIIPLQDVTPRVGTRLPDPLVIAVFPGGDDELSLYEDDGESLDYQEEAYTRWPLTLRDGGRTRTLTFAPLVGNFPDRP